MLLNIDFDVDRVAERCAIGRDRLPFADEEVRAEWGVENNADRCLSPSAGGVESDLFGSAEGVSIGVAQAVVRIPVAGAVVFDQPLLVDEFALVVDRIIGNGRIRYEFQIVGAFFGAKGGSECGGYLDGWEGRRLHKDLTCGLDDECRFDERSLFRGRDEGRGGGEGGTGGSQEKNRNNGEQVSAWKEAH